MKESVAAAWISQLAEALIKIAQGVGLKRPRKSKEYDENTQCLRAYQPPSEIFHYLPLDAG